MEIKTQEWLQSYKDLNDEMGLRAAIETLYFVDLINGNEYTQWIRIAHEMGLASAQKIMSVIAQPYCAESNVSLGAKS